LFGRGTFLYTAKRIYAEHWQLPGWRSIIRREIPRICHTDFASFTPGMRTWSTLFQRYCPKKSRSRKTISTVMNDTSAERNGAAFMPV